jgi:hypothetical protein
MGKIAWLGASTMKATDYGGVLPSQTFAYLASQSTGLYDMTGGHVDSNGYYVTNGYINAGIDSDSAPGMLSRLPGILAQLPTTLVIQIGLEDYVLNTPLATLASTVVSIVSQANAAGCKVIAVNDVYERSSTPGWIQGYYAYLLQVEQTCAQAGCALVDIYREYLTYYILDGYTAFDALYADGIVHQSVAGNAWIAGIFERPRYAGVFI